mmetsp:Transcript_34779/g.63312  ORF Transcript_34779/g.63312 Transcript_34779/m.63312 type:complete len:434 (+) Transcript_34779:97-1398(+)|eukprot:CAMPEP_0197656302 /NCGR_PEP_ID=MMETSP1338-20131121/41242_1 /TAXON_ID=43686 ORGANISM="Pelagodinium beii, Strain RCC1491" /NCGR_SAMPLE_ID=MMETSP1338 /ASSEMBLY_ACC=CAM_ASM_000754 /LENGTH=433 /DNA_ID=CAMNT_0043232239 /DNA_START=36 /DNA_END=1337 /DNA_ORIENTATION=+
MSSSCSTSVSHSNAVAMGMLQMASNVTRGLNSSVNDDASMLQEALLTRQSLGVIIASRLSGTSILILCLTVWLFLVFVTLLITSILPCLFRRFQEEPKLPDVTVESTENSEDGVKQGNWLGNLVGKAVEAYDTKKALGVDVKIGSISVFATTGEVELTDLVVHSPDGYYSPLLQISRVLVDLDMSKLIYSLGSDIVVEKTELEDFTLTIEKTFTTSNLNDFLHFLSSKNENLQEATKVEKQAEASTEKSKGFFSSWFSKKEQADPEGNRSMTLREISLKQIGVKMGFYCLAGSGLSLRAGDLGWKDFDTEMCKDMGTTTVPLDIIPFLVMTLLRTILDNVLGDKITEVVQQGVMDACGEVLESATLVNSTLAAGVQEGAQQVGQVVTAGADAAMAVSGKAVDVGGAAVSAGSLMISRAGTTASSLLHQPGSAN